MANNDHLTVLNNNIINTVGRLSDSKESISAKPRLSKEEVKNKLDLILHRIAVYKIRGEIPPASLIADAFALAELYPFGDILEKLKEITTIAYEAAKAAAENGTLPKDSWLLSEERKLFDELFARNPSLALEQYLKSPDIIEDIETSQDIRDGKFVSEDRRQKARIKAISEEEIYKRAVLAPFVALKAEIVKQQGNIVENEKYNQKLAYFAHKELTNQAFLERKNIRQKERRSTDNHIVLKEDGHIIDRATDHAIKRIEQTIEGGLAAVGAAMTKTPEVIKDALEDRMERVAETVGIAKREIEQDAITTIETKIREEALAATRPAMEALQKQEEIEVKTEIVEQAAVQEQEEINEIFEDKKAHTKTQTQAADDKEAKRLARAAKKKAKKSLEEDSKDPSKLRNALKTHGTVSKGANKSKTPDNSPVTQHSQHGSSLDK
ncbi:MAG: hypothetical protein N4A31_03705 [Rickettsiales bacterium]|jgi:hypothetical protein|nr:hypothetical protein [Rickettsiales bacterium]